MGAGKQCRTAGDLCDLNATCEALANFGRALANVELFKKVAGKENARKV